MKKNLFKNLIVILLMALVISAGTLPSLAISTADAKEAIDPTKECSLELTLRSETKVYGGLTVRLYQFADVSADFQFAAAGSFAGYPLRINGIQASSEWDALASTLGSYIVADKITPDASAVTDENGVVLIEHLPVGLYYLAFSGEGSAVFAPFILSVPSLGEDGCWIYDVSALPKPGEEPEPGSTTYTVIKEWKNIEQIPAAHRKTSVIVELYKNGELCETVTLSGKNNWTYTWESAEEDVWTVAEREITGKYSVTIEKDQTTFTVTNTFEGDPQDPKDTGDAVRPFWWCALLLALGIALWLTGLKKHEEN